MKQEFPKMVYLTRESNKIVQNERELQNAISEGFKLHWQDTAIVRIDIDEPKQVETVVTQINKKVKKK